MQKISEPESTGHRQDDAFLPFVLRADVTSAKQDVIQVLTCVWQVTLLAGVANKCGNTQVYEQIGQ